MKAPVKTLLRHAARYVRVRPKLHHAALALLNHIPGMKSRLMPMIIGDSKLHAAVAHVSKDMADLTPRARRIYTNLQSAIGRRQK